MTGKLQRHACLSPPIVTRLVACVLEQARIKLLSKARSCSYMHASTRFGYLSLRRTPYVGSKTGRLGPVQVKLSRLFRAVFMLDGYFTLSIVS